MNLKITISGLVEFLAKLNRKRTAIKRGIQTALEKIGEMVVDKSKENCPEESGQLESDIQYTVGRNFVDIGVPRGAKSSPYAYFIHYGRYKEGEETRSKGAGRLFISKAIRELDREIKRELEYVLEAN